MSTVAEAKLKPTNIRSLHARMGRVYHQPVSVASFTNKRVTVSFRVPVKQVQRLLPSEVEADEVESTGYGIVSMCACDFFVTRIGPIPMPRIHTNEMLCRISAKVKKRGQIYRAYYTLRSDASSRFLGFLGGRFSHFRKRVSKFSKRDDGKTYELVCHAKDELCRGRLSVGLDSLSKSPPETTIFAGIDEATDFVLGLDGSCGYDFTSGRLSLQKIDFPEWDTRFCHEYKFEFSLLDFLFKEYELDAVLDHALFMENVAQTWGTSWLYEPDNEPIRGTRRNADSKASKAIQH